ncbi:hypothetical protein KXS11_08830 [Plantibacter flavus]|uniref:hypothetical protein n=1 Tax=Plantibacter flavus TaxID=150123 RepID=UPI003F1396EE
MSVPARRRHVARVCAALAAGFLIVTAGTGAAAGSAPAAPGQVTAATDDREGPQFYTGTVVDVTGTIDGDVYAAGQDITISGDVTGDVIAAGQTITVNGSVDGNVRLAGQNVTINGDVTRSSTVFASTITVSDTGTLGEDLVGGASDIRIAGDVGRDLVVSTGTLSIDGTVGGDVTYTSDSTARIADGAVSGSVTQVEPPQTKPVEISPWAAFLAWALGVLYALVALSLITLVAGLLVPRVLQRVTDRLVPSPWKALLVGFVACIAVPALLIALLITVVGAPLALAGMLIWTVVVFSTFLYGSYWLGRLLFRDRHHPVVKSLVGGIILIVALQIPWLNILVWFAMVCFGVGAQLLEIQRRRPWVLRSESDRTPAPVPTGVGMPTATSTPSDTPTPTDTPAPTGIPMQTATATAEPDTENPTMHDESPHPEPRPRNTEIGGTS